MLIALLTIVWIQIKEYKILLATVAKICILYKIWTNQIAIKPQSICVPN